MSLRTILGVARNDLHGIRSAWRTAMMSEELAEGFVIQVDLL